MRAVMLQRWPLPPFLGADGWSVVPGEGLSYFRDDAAAPVLLHDAVMLVS